MTPLISLQNQFQNYLLKEQADIEKAIVDSEKVPVSQRLFIYLDSYRCRLIDSLASNFPTLKDYLGFETFHQFASTYIDKYPSPYRSIRWYGHIFADYLREQHQPFLSELAEFEWKMTLAFDASDEEVLKIEEMAAIPPETWADIRFNPLSSLQRIDCYWNSIELWQALSNDEEPAKPTKSSTCKSWVLWRKDYLNHFYILAKEEAWALDALIKGATFGELCEGLCEWVDEEEVGMLAASFLKGWIQAGLLQGIAI